MFRFISFITYTTIFHGLAIFPVAKVFIFKTNKVVSSLSPLFQSMSYVFIASMRDLSLIAAH